MSPGISTYCSIEEINPLPLFGQTIRQKTGSKPCDIHISTLTSEPE